MADPFQFPQLTPFDGPIEPLPHWPTRGGPVVWKPETVVFLDMIETESGAGRAVTLAVRDFDGEWHTITVSMGEIMGK